LTSGEQEEEEKEERPTKRARVNGCGVEQGKEEGVPLLCSPTLEMTY